jgi:hypothetical protein
VGTASELEGWGVIREGQEGMEGGLVRAVALYTGTVADRAAKPPAADICSGDEM